MSRICPETGEKVLYLECQECETKTCRITRNTKKSNDTYGIKDNNIKKS